MNPLYKDQPVITMPSQAQKEEAARWFAELRDKICAELEKIEEEYLAQKQSGPRGGAPPSGGAQSEWPEKFQAEAGRFSYKNWERETPDGLPGGGGQMGLLKGSVFEKGGVNVSTVYGHFSPDLRAQIPGAEGNGAFWASGISLVLHPRNPHVPAVHMNTRHITTARGWFGGGSDLTPVFPQAEDTAAFHAQLQAACDRHDSRYYPAYRQWCDEYFHIKHRNEARGVGGIFYDYQDSGNWEADFAFTRDVGLAFLAIYPQLVRKSMFKSWDAADRQAQLVKRGRYAEFNLVYDRGTKFGLMTGGNTEAILMSLPPEASWP
jgi:coproporphyrinogen III oxidase